MHLRHSKFVGLRDDKIRVKSREDYRLSKPSSSRPRAVPLDDKQGRQASDWQVSEFGSKRPALIIVQY